MEGIGVEVIGGLLVVAILGIGAALLARLRRRRARENTATSESEREAEVERIRVLREQVLEVARARDITLAERSKGFDPTVVTFSDGQLSWFYYDLSSYKRGLTSHQANPRRASWGKPPRPVSKWDRSTLGKWLADHADSDPASMGSQYVGEAAKWYDSVWTTVAREYSP